MTQRRFASELVHLFIFNCQTACASFVARMERSVIRDRGVSSRIALRSIRATSRRAPSPRVWSGPRACRLSCSSSPRRGVRNDRAFHRARGARMCWMRAARMPFSVGTRAVAQPNAEDRWAEPGRGSRSSPAFRTRVDFAACCMSQGLSLAPTRPRSCELSPGHALGPSARCAGVCPVRREDQKSSHVSGTRHRCGHRIPLPRIEDDRDAPLTGAGWRSTI